MSSGNRRAVSPLPHRLAHHPPFCPLPLPLPSLAGPDDPCHSFDCITQQVYGYDKPVNETAPALMNGFAANAISIKGNVPFALSAYNASNLPVMSALAQEFALFDHWHVSIPTCTNPNREFAMSGTSDGALDNNFPTDGFPQQTHFKFLESRGLSWKLIYTDDPWMGPAFADLRTNESLAFIQEIPNFFSDLANNTLPNYTFIQPRMATSKTGPSNWQHPDNSVEAGEALLADIYSAIRNSSYWERILFVITYDEHGGFADHQANPQTGIPSPDGIPGTNGFQFDRLGVRVPTIAVSPWIAKGTVVHTPTGSQAPTPTSQWDATSLIATTNRIFGIQDNMTARDAWAGRFDDLVSGAYTGGKPRTDCPLTMPAPLPVSPDRLEREMKRPLNDHHLDSLAVLCQIEDTKAVHPVCEGYAATVDRATHRSRYLAQLRVRAGEPRRASDSAAESAADVAWVASTGYKTLDASIARRLQQQDFEDISRALFAQYRRQVSDKAAAAAKAEGPAVEAALE
jgi:phospholipase C